MKLHLGCGSIYLAGYINSDPFRTAIADASYPAWRLPYPENSVEEIVSLQVWEHLGRLPAAFAAAESCRVLQDGGKLVIETVDLETTLARQPLDREWLCGVDAPGMLHRFCFSEPALRELLTGAGFEISGVARAMRHDKPVLRVEARKRADFGCVLLARLQRTWLDAKLLQLPLKHEEDAAFAEMIEPLRRLLGAAPPDFDAAAALGLVAPFHPGAAASLFALLLDEPRFTARRSDLQRAHDTAKRLAERKLPAHLAHLYFRTEKPAGSAALIFERVIEIARRYAGGLYRGEDKETLLPLQLQIWSSALPPPAFRRLRNFSPLALKLLAQHLELKGIKGFACGRLREADKLLQQAAACNPNNCFAYWNLARLRLGAGRIPEAIIQYERALETTPPELRAELLEEVRGVTRGGVRDCYREAKQHVHY